MFNFVQEFKKFAMRGSLIDLAVGLAIGGAFQKIVASFVGDVVLPTLNPFLGIIEFKELSIGAMKVGNFIEAFINFSIIVICVFFLIKAINSIKEFRTKDKNIYLSKQERLLIEIRDLLKKQN